MSGHDFTLILSGNPDEHLDELFEAGCDDSTFGSVDGVAYASFDREAETFREAVFSALNQVESVGGIRVLRVEPDDLVTAADIAQRLDRSRESVRLLASGKRGAGTFPPPVSHATSRSRLWRWSQVAAWAGEGDHARARLVAVLNAALELRTQRDGLDPVEQSTVNRLVSVET